MEKLHYQVIIYNITQDLVVNIPAAIITTASADATTTTTTITILVVLLVSHHLHNDNK